MSNGPLCPGGRCGEILAAIAEAQTMTRLNEQYGRALAAVIRGVLTDFGVSASREDVSASVVRHIVRVTGIRGGTPRREYLPGASGG